MFMALELTILRVYQIFLFVEQENVMH